MISIDASVILQMINFLFLIWALNIVLYRPIRRILLQRKEKVANLEQKIVSFDNDLNRKTDEFAFGIKEARRKGLLDKEVLLAGAAEEEKNIIKKINTRAQADIAEVRKKIASEVETVRQSLQKEIDVFAKAVGEKILGRTI